MNAMTEITYMHLANNTLGDTNTTIATMKDSKLSFGFKRDYLKTMVELELGETEADFAGDFIRWAIEEIDFPGLVETFMGH